MTKSKYVANAGLSLALLIIVQFVLRGLGQIPTGIGVNFILAMSALFLGYACSISLAVLSPIFAFLLGLGPAFLPLVPCIALGNLAYVICIRYLMNTFILGKGKKFEIIAVIPAAILKFLVLYLLVVELAIPSLGLATEKAKVITSMFSFPQLITATLGGILACLISSYIKKNNDAS